MKKLIASVATTAMLAGGLAVLAAAAPATADVASPVASPAASATCEVLTVNLAGYDVRPAVGEPQVEVANPAYVPAVAAVAEVSHTDYEYKTLAGLFPVKWTYRTAHKNGGAAVLYDWKIWTATGKTSKHVEVAGVAAVPAVGTPTVRVANPAYVAADETPNTVTVTVNGIAEVNAAFGETYTKAITFADKSVRNAWSVDVTSWNGASVHLEEVSTACVTPIAPTWVDTCGPANNGHWVLPAVVGYTYAVTDHSTLNGKVGVVATPQDGYAFTTGARKQWTATQNNDRCGQTVPTVVFTDEVCTAPVGYGLGTITPASLGITNPDGVKVLVKRKSDGAAITALSNLTPGHYDVIATVKNESADAFTTVPAGWTLFAKDGVTFKVSKGFDVVAAAPCDKPVPVATVSVPTANDRCGSVNDGVTFGDSTGGTWKIASKVADAPDHEGTTRYRVVFTPTGDHVLPTVLPGDGFVVDGKAVWLVYLDNTDCAAGLVA
ncbi:hypothetical protein [Agromyces sp. Leaf222]|uniref:hypothetical protein n=1 Tax=Agromyces sp. Leaf222 TaxID=1735688 RepID=UPI0006FC27AA|nr:hypothetical protein [Agromyces sp. Leaf222]KQM81328.1 hypothetical protein ASE68_16205 [Agromyces sp. Leaf222]